MNWKAMLMALVAALLLTACQDDEPPRIEREQKGREETRSIRNTEAIGYDGDRIADKVDQGLDAMEEREARGREEIDEQTE